MECLRCQSEVAPGKALCPTCLLGQPVLTPETLKVQSALIRHREVAKNVGEFDYAGFWLRAAASLFDGIILGGIQKVFWFSISLVWGADVVQSLLLGASESLDPTQIVSRSLKGMIWFYLLPVIFYYGLFESSRWQGTPGKILLGLRVTNLDGERLDFHRGLIRALSRLSNLVAVLPVVFTLVSSPNLSWDSVILNLLFPFFYIPFTYAMAGFTDQKQAMHDKIASTLVIKGPRFSRKRGYIGLMIAMWIFTFVLINAVSNPRTGMAINGAAKIIWRMIW